MVYINTSDIAAFIGQSKWDIVTPFERFWKNNDKGFSALVDSNSNVGLTNKEVVEKCIGKEKVTSIINDVSLSHDEKKDQITEACITAGGEANISSIQSLVNTEHGIKNEEKVIKIIEEKILMSKRSSIIVLRSAAESCIKGMKEELPIIAI